MDDYVALLGRINVGGRTVTMQRLRELVAELGYERVGTYIQTGNVFFRAAGTDADAIAGELTGHLGERLGYSVPVFVRSLPELMSVAATDPFAGIDVDDETRLLVVFMSTGLPANVELPVVDDRKGFRITGTAGREAFVVLRLVNGRPGNVVEWVERRYGVQATGRFAHTMTKIVRAAERHLSPLSS